MNRQDHITGPAFLLVVGRTIGMVASFAIGPLFARTFDVGEMGTYKTFFLLFPTLYGLAQLGMAESLYYFVPRANGHVGRYVCNAALSLLAAGLAAMALLVGFREPLAAYFGNPAIVDFIVPLGLFLTLMLVGTVLEITMISRKQHWGAAAAYALSDIAKTALFVVPALLFASLPAVFLGAVVFAALRLATMLVIVWRQYGREFRPDFAIWRTQLAYALPFATAVGMEVILLKYHEFFVAGAVDTATYAIFAMGCMTIPLVDLVMTSTTSVMMVKMADTPDDHRETLGLFHDTVARMAFLIAPVAIGLAVLAQPFIITIYTDVYAASVPIFTVWALSYLPAIVAVDAFLRAYAQTRFLMVMNLVRLGVVVALIGWFMQTFGLPGAVIVTLVATLAAKALALGRIARLLHVSMVGVLPWAALARIGARALAAGVPAWLLAQAFASTPWLAFVTGGLAYGATYLTLCYAPGIAEPAAIRLPIVQRLQGLRRGLARSAAPNPGHTMDDSAGRREFARSAARHPPHTMDDSVGRVPRSGPVEAATIAVRRT